MDEVKRFFEQPPFANQADLIGGYARWALLPDGPAFHEVPAPMTCEVGRDHADYIVCFISSSPLTRTA
jgi:hypothetical protein